MTEFEPATLSVPDAVILLSLQQFPPFPSSAFSEINGRRRRVASPADTGRCRSVKSNVPTLDRIVWFEEKWSNEHIAPATARHQRKVIRSHFRAPSR